METLIVIGLFIWSVLGAVYISWWCKRSDFTPYDYFLGGPLTWSLMAVVLLQEWLDKDTEDYEDTDNELEGGESKRRDRSESWHRFW